MFGLLGRRMVVRRRNELSQIRSIPMEQNKNNEPSDNTTSDRREAIQKLGRFAACAAPFTVLALTKKADAATGHGPGKHP